ncbi:hypothetical protein FXB40_03245 [Bradyrhizobium rifense]|uniref:Uncharacterized protein n=1 Tax=Bradyrhizobium rifense TaxID=515499 RepID=A0A5D3KZY8_9BRAD|nr:hypothetical protein [Bradyrhizobium rifense]TYL99146.1 hypothetical protein FXB40_03245 [Bradyrhizobium rifense]
MPEVGAVFVLQHCRGRSIAPELMIPDAAESGYFCGIRSELRLCEEPFETMTPEHMLLGSDREQTPDWMIAAFLRAPKHEHSFVSLNWWKISPPLPQMAPAASEDL